MPHHMNGHNGFLASWLKDAYSMENGIVHTLENHVKDAKDYPTVQSKLQDHLEKTQCHAGMVKECIERLGDSPSSIKSALGNIMGSVQGVASGPTQDEIVKNALADYATEHFEIACYRSLIAAAQTYGDTETVRACESILRDEEDMARWLDMNIPTMTVEYMGKEGTERRAA